MNADVNGNILKFIHKSNGVNIFIPVYYVSNYSKKKKINHNKVMSVCDSTWTPLLQSPN